MQGIPITLFMVQECRRQFDPVFDTISVHFKETMNDFWWMWGVFFADTDRDERSITSDENEIYFREVDFFVGHDFVIRQFVDEEFLKDEIRK